MPVKRQEASMVDSNIEHLKQQQAQLHHVSEHLANERTILAWVRTAIAIITLGIAINRFSLFLIEFSRTVPGGRTANIHAEELGIGLVILGVVVMLGGIWHYLDVARAIDDGSYRPSRIRIVVPATIVVLLGGASLVWLLW
jgi:putative membrane protein